MQAAVASIEGPRRAASVLKPVRQRILGLLRDPNSASGVAAALGLPRQRVGYHVRELEESGLLRHVGDRQKGNCVERLLQATARQYVIAPRVLGPLAPRPDVVRDRFSSDYLLAVAAKTVNDVGRLQRLATDAEKQLPTFTLDTELRFGSPADQGAFAEELANTVATLVRKYHQQHAAGGRRFRLVINSHPVLPENTSPSGGEGDDGSDE